MKPAAQLRHLTNTLRHTSLDHPGEVRQACVDLYQFLVKTSEINPDDAGSREHVFSAGGKAIGTTWAAMCINDFYRTKQFTDGLYQAVTDLLDQGHKPVRILYAGSGPFATLTLPLFASFTPEQVQVTLLEINKDSFNHVKELARVLEFDAWLEDVVLTDALLYEVPGAATYDILLSETLQRGLLQEPQVSLVMHLLPQMPENCRLIPEEIEVGAVLMHKQYSLYVQRKNDEYFLPLGTVFLLNKQTALEMARHHHTGDDIPGPVLPLPREGLSAWHALALSTRITVYGNHFIEARKSGLTIPHKIETDLKKLDGCHQLHFTYKTGHQPGPQFTAE